MMINRKITSGSAIPAFFALALALFPLLSSGQGFTFPIREMSNVLHGSSMSTGTNVMVVANDQRTNMLASPASFGNTVKYKANHTIVKLAIDHAATTVPSAPYIYKMAYTIEGSTSLSTPAFSFSASDTMVVAYNPDSLTAYQDMQVRTYPRLYNAQLTITGFYDITSGTPVALSTPTPNKNYYVELAMQYQPYLKTHIVPADMKQVTSRLFDFSKQVLNVSWEPYTAPAHLGIVTPARYELEWTYVDNYAPDGSVLPTSSLTYNFKNNATRIITDSLSYGIPMIYPRGYVVYRVRMIRPDSSLYRYPIYGVWSLDSSKGTVGALPASSYYIVPTPHTNDELNWNYTIHFAEGGKYKHVIGYFDGLLKNRQTVTRFNTNPGRILVTENIYDYEGRPAITTLPAVVNANAFGYQSGVSISDATGQPYGPGDFDLKAVSCPDDPQVPAFTEGSLANRYYSRLNTDTAGMQKFVPQAEGFPFVHTQLSPGFSDRVDAMGGAGPLLQINRGHDTKHEYMQADQPDLNNLFGINAGIGSFYKKTMSKDPNGQNSMIVKDYKGRQIVSSYVGASVDTTRIAMIFNDEVPFSGKARENKLADPATNVIVGSEKKYNGSFYMDFDAMSNIKYEYAFKPYTVCDSPYLGLTVKCRYDYDLHDNCGKEVLFKQGVLGVTGVTTSTIPVPFSEDTNILLNKGKYTIRKTLTIADQDVVAAVDSFFNHQPNCLKTENDFIREAVERNTYPCPAEDACTTLKKEMMQQLFTRAKYGGIREGGYDRPFVGGSDDPSINSIYDIPQTGPGGTEAKYRYQNDCVHMALDSLVIKRNGYIYKHIAGPEMVVIDEATGDSTVYTERRDLVYKFVTEIYRGSDQWKIAEALLPLHPEYCKLTSCFEDTLEMRLKALPDAAAAIKYNLFNLQDIVDRDMQLRSRMLLSPFNMTHIEDSLKLMMGGTIRIDTMASMMAFCLIPDIAAFTDARRFFHDDYTNLVFPSAKVKDKYFEHQRTFYLANRMKYVGMARSGAGDGCPPCDSNARMRLIPDPLVPVTYGADGSYNFGPDGFLSLLSDSALADVKRWLDRTARMPADTTGMAEMRDTAFLIVHKADSTLSSVVADSIVARLANCFGSGGSARFKDSLIALIRRGEVHEGMFFPEQVRKAIVQSGLSLSDLCHPYLVNYDYYDDSRGGRGNCNSPSFYQAMTDFFNIPSINAPFKSASPWYDYSTPSWPSTNAFALKVAAGITGGSGPIQMGVRYNPADSVYVCSFFKTGSDSVTLSLRSPKNIRRSGLVIPFLEVAASDSIIFRKVYCFYDDPTVNVDAHIGRYTFYASIERSEALSGVQVINTGQFLGWNNNKVQMNEAGGNPLSSCVPCTQFRAQFEAFADSMTLYGGFAQDHPLFKRSLRSFMNFNLKKSYSLDQYVRFLNSCALADSMRIPMYGGYARISFPTPTGPYYADFEAFKEAIAVSDGIPLGAIADYKVAGTETVIIDYSGVPLAKMKTFNDKLLLSGGQLKAGSSVAGTLFLPLGTDTATLMAGSGLRLSGATAIELRPSPYLPDWSSYVRYDVTADTPSYLRLARGSELVRRALYNLGVDGQWLPNNYATVNGDYFKAGKQELLRYTYSMDTLSPARVLDTLQSLFVQQNVSAFAGTEVSYNNPENAYRFTDLYYTDSSSRFPGFDTIARVLTYAKGALGGSRIFIPNNVNTVNVFGGSGSGDNLIMYRCADDLYWYRYFGKYNQMFNIFIRIPQYIYKSQHPSFMLVRIAPAVGDTASSAFTAVLRNPLTGDTIYARGTTNFDIAWSQKLRDVLLGNEANFSKEKAPPLSGEMGAEPNCEQKLLANDIYEGKINYQNYIAGYYDRLLAAFREHVMNQVGEKLWIEYIDMRFGTTLFAYDRAGNLIRTVPPEGVRKLDSANASRVDSLRAGNIVLPSAIPQHKKVSSYEYNTANRPWKENTPDAGTKLLYYDFKGNVLLSQSQAQRDHPSNFFTYFLYDGQNRLTETGQVSWNESCPSFDYMPLYVFQQGTYVKTPKPFPCACENLIDSVWEYCGPTNTKFYDHTLFNAMIRSMDREQVVFTMYDSAFVPLQTKSNQEAQENMRNRIAANMYYLAVPPGMPGNNFDHATHYSYDAAGNIKTLVQDFPQLEGVKQRYKRIDYDYDLLSGKVNMISYNHGFADQFFQRYAYDADNRLSRVETSRDGLIWKRDAEYTYYQHGPLARTSLGDQRVQGIDYAYTLQGWLKSINGDLADTLSDMGGDGRRSTIVPRDVYATTLDYFTGDYKPIGNTQASRLLAPAKSLYNGNIARQSTDVAPFGGLTTAYVYDQMNRIRKANYAQTKRDSVLQFNNWYASSYRYDMDGNLRTLMRKQGSGITMDSLHYRYHDSGIHNKVSDVLDFASFSTPGVQDIRSGLGAGPGFPRILYDADGNVTNDFTGGIEGMKWNIYGKATQINPMQGPTLGDLFFGYDALGHRTYKWRQQQVDSGNLYHHTFYVREASGNILAEYNMLQDFDFGGYFKVVKVLRGSVTWSTWVDAIGSMGYTLDPAFSSYIIAHAGASSLFPTGYYLAADPGMRSGFISGGFGVLEALGRYSLATGKYPVADALRTSMMQTNPATTITTISDAVFGNPDPTLRNHALLQAAQMLPDLYDAVVQQNQLTILSPADSANLFNIMFNIAQSNLPWYAGQISSLWQQDPAVLDNWLNAVTADTLYTQSPWYQGYTSLLNNTLEDFADQAAYDASVVSGTDKRTEGLYGFASWWPSSSSVLDALGYTSASLDKVAYFDDPVAYLGGITDFALVDTALSLVGNMDFVELARQAGLDLSDKYTVVEPALRLQSISLGSHHLYGSSRLGIDNYFPAQYRNLWDFSNGVTDTALNIPLPWYSYAYNDLIDTGKVSPWGNALSRSATAQHLLGQKQYEVASQLGNVHSTLSDKRFVKRTPAGARDYFNTAVVSAYDYYPYGMLMPGRYVSDTTPVCVTSTQMRLMPKKTVTDVLPLATFIAPGTLGTGPYGKTVYGQGGGMNIEIPVTAGVPINITVELSYIYSSFVTVEVSEAAGSGRRILGSRNFTYPLSNTFPVTPSGTDIRVKMMMMSSFVSAPPGGLFAASVANYEKVSYESQPVLVTLCSRNEDKYEFGYNGQMKMNEVAGMGNWNTARYWEHSNQQGLRKNPDPVKIPWESPYCTFNGNPIWKSDPDGDYSKAGAWLRNVWNGGNGITKNKASGEWGYKTSRREKDETGQTVYAFGVRFQDPAKSGKDNSKSNWVQGIFDKLNNSWLNSKGTTVDDYAKNRGSSVNEAGVLWTNERGQGMETTTAKNILFMDSWAIPGANAGGSPGIASNRFKYKGIDLQFNFSDWGNAAESFMGGVNDLKDYMSGDKPLIRKVGPRDKSLYDTSDLFQFQKKTWHLRAKDGDTLPAFDGTKQ